MLSKKQWVEKHQQRLDGLSRSDVDARYADYRAQHARPKAARQPRAELLHRSVTRPQRHHVEEAVKAAQKRSLENNEYFKQLAAPFLVGPGQPAVGFPDGVTSTSSVVAVTWDEMVNADTNGNAALFLRPMGPEFCLMTSGEMSDATKTWYSGGTPLDEVGNYPNLMWSLNNGSGAFTQTGLDAILDDYVNVNALAGSYAGWSAQSAPNLNALKSAYSAVRCVGAAIEIFNPNSDVERKGTLGVATWDGSLGAPTLYNANLNIGVARGPDVDPNALATGVNYKNVSALPTFTEFTMNTPSATTTVRWCPLDAQAAGDFRPTSYRPSWVNPYVTGVLAEDTNPIGPGLLDNMALAVAPAIGTNSDQLRTFYDAFFANFPAVGNSDSNGFTTNYNYATLYGRSPPAGNPLPVWADNARHREAAFSLTSMGDGDAGIIVVASGLEPSTSETDVSDHTRILAVKPAFRARIRLIYECLPANSSFVPATGHAATTASSAVAGVKAGMVIPPATAGKTSTATVTSAISDAVKWTATHGGAIVDAASSIADAASTSSWGDLAASILEAVGLLFL